MDAQPPQLFGHPAVWFESDATWHWFIAGDVYGIRLGRDQRPIAVIVGCASTYSDDALRDPVRFLEATIHTKASELVDIIKCKCHTKCDRI